MVGELYGKTYGFAKIRVAPYCRSSAYPWWGVILVLLLG
jgi:hypothetical protein